MPGRGPVPPSNTGTGGPSPGGASVAQLALQRRLDQLAERLTALACATLRGREQLVRDGHRGAHDAQNSASQAPTILHVSNSIADEPALTDPDLTASGSWR